MDEREAKLPRWAQDLLAHQRKVIQSGNEPLIKEVTKLRPENERLNAVNGAYRELLEKAANGGHVTAKQIVEVISGYCLQLVKDDEPVVETSNKKKALDLIWDTGELLDKYIPDKTSRDEVKRVLIRVVGLIESN